MRHLLSIFSKFRILVSLFSLTLKASFLIYPAIMITLVMFDPQLKESGQSWLVPMLFKTTITKYNSWAEEHISLDKAKNARGIALEEWPMFGAVFILKTIESLQNQGKIEIKDEDVSLAIKNAVNIISSPSTAEWVKRRWKRRYLKTGQTYLESENVFYRMLLIMGLSSYKKITGDIKYDNLINQQYKSLHNELLKAKYHLRDDYPTECYPVDVLWAVASIKQANMVMGNQIDTKELERVFMQTLNSQVRDKRGLPAFTVFSRKGVILQKARGAGTSGLLTFASALDREIAKEWYNSYERYFWKDNRWFIGFREYPKGEPNTPDVDSGPIIKEFGSVATLFGIGASKSVGRLDHTVPLTVEAIASLWATPFGFIIPSFGGKMLVDSWALGDVALMFSMTRTINADEITQFNGSYPWSVWAILFSLLSLGIVSIWLELKWLKKLIFR